MSIYTDACKWRWEIGTTIPNRIRFFFQGQPHILISGIKHPRLGFQRTEAPYLSYYKNRLIERRSYRRRPHHQKKVLTPEELQRREWKRSKQCDKHWEGYCHEGPFVKRLGVRRERARVRALLAKERYEEATVEFRKRFVDFW